MVSALWAGVALMPALLMRTSIVALVSLMSLMAVDAKFAIDGREDVSQVSTWTFEPLVMAAVRDERSVVSVLVDRTVAITVFGCDDVVSCRTNSRPMPRFAPVMM